MRGLSPLGCGAPGPSGSAAPRPYGTALARTLMSLEADLVSSSQQAGSTALVALLVDCALHLANVGDCRAVVCDDAEARALTRDHKPASNELEKARLAKLGASLSSDGYVQLAVEGAAVTDLMLSRALGGAHIKRGSTTLLQGGNSTGQVGSNFHCNGAWTCISGDVCVTLKAQRKPMALWVKDLAPHTVTHSLTHTHTHAAGG